MSEAETVICVSVRSNLVSAIRHVSRDAAGEATVYDDRLAVSTELTRNNQLNGCFDGDYFLDDAETARHFAALCLGYMKNLCETSSDAVSALDLSSGNDWISPHVPKA